jgi:hypothetical protein
MEAFPAQVFDIETELKLAYCRPRVELEAFLARVLDFEVTDLKSARRYCRSMVEMEASLELVFGIAMTDLMLTYRHPKVEVTAFLDVRVEIETTDRQKVEMEAFLEWVLDIEMIEQTLIKESCKEHCRHLAHHLEERQVSRED